MAAGPSAKLKIEGLAELKSAMNQAKSAVKALDAEIAASAAAYKESGDQEKYNKEQTKLLNEQLQEQETVVSSARAAMQKMKDAGQEGSAGYNAMRTAAANAEGKLASIRTQLRGVSESTGDAASGIGSVADETSDLAAKADGATTETVGLKSAMDNLGAVVSLKGIADGLESIRKTAVKVGQKIIDIGKDTWKAGADAAAWADDMATAARDAGNVNVEDYQRWQYASQIIDVSVDSIVKAQDKLVKASESKGTGDGYLNILDFLTEESRASVTLSEDIAKISRFNEDGSLKSANELLWDTVDAISQMENETQKEIIAQGIFGRSYRDVYGLFQEGAQENFVKAMAEITPLTEEQITSMLELSDSLDLLNMSYDNAKMALFAALAPSLEKIAKSFTTIFGKVQEWASSPEGSAAIDNFGAAIGGIVTDFTDGDLTDALEKATGFITDMSESLGELKGVDLSEWIDGISKGFLTLVTAEGVVKFLEFAAQLKTLFGGKGISGHVTASVTQTVTSTLDGTATAALSGIGGTLSSILSVLGPIAVAVAALKIGWDLVNPEHQGETANKINHMFEGTELEKFAKKLQESENETVREVGEAIETSQQNFESAATRMVLGLQQSMTGQNGLLGVDTAGTTQMDPDKTYVIDMKTGKMREIESAAQPERVEQKQAEKDYGAAWAEAASAVVEQAWDAFKVGALGGDWEDFDSAWEDVESIFTGMPDQLQWVSDVMDEMVREFQLGDPLREDFGQWSWFKNEADEAYAALNEVGVRGMSEVVAGLDSVIPTVSASVARFNAILSQAGAVTPATASAGNTYNNSNTYIENYNASVRGGGVAPVALSDYGV